MSLCSRRYHDVLLGKAVDGDGGDDADDDDDGDDDDETSDASAFFVAFFLHLIKALEEQCCLPDCQIPLGWKASK